MSRFVSGFGLFALAACATTPPLVGAEKALADKVHSYVYEGNERYQREVLIKAMAFCIVWPDALTEPVKVYFSPWSRLSITSDGNLPINDLAVHALDRCNTITKDYGIACDCQVVDKNGSNVVSLPPRVRSLLVGKTVDFAVPEIESVDTSYAKRVDPPEPSYEEPSAFETKYRELGGKGNERLPEQRAPKP